MPQVTILEGGKPKSFAGVDKLQIALSGGGTSLWVPKDTRLLTSLTATENGVYPPPEGYFGFDTAIVNVPSSQVEGYKDGIDYIIVGSKPMKPDIPSGEKPTWPTVPDDPYDPDNDDGYGWDPWIDDNPWDKDPYDDDWDEGEPELTETKVPTTMRVTKPPTKDSYVEGETIGYRGIEVTLYDNMGNVFSNEHYVDGIIPFSELTFPDQIAHGGGTVPTHSETYMGGGGLTLAVENASPSLRTKFYSYYSDFYEGTYWPNCILISTMPETVRFSGLPSTETPSPITLNRTLVNDEGTTIYWSNIDFNGDDGGPIYGPVVTDSGYDNLVKSLSVGMIPLFEGDMSAAVQWNSPFDGRTLEDYVTIHVTPKTEGSGGSNPDGGGGSFSGGGGEGIGGEGGGGGF